MRLWLLRRSLLPAAPLLLPPRPLLLTLLGVLHSSMIRSCCCMYTLSVLQETLLLLLSPGVCEPAESTMCWRRPNKPTHSASTTYPSCCRCCSCCCSLLHEVLLLLQELLLRHMLVLLLLCNGGLQLWRQLRWRGGLLGVVAVQMHPTSPMLQLTFELSHEAVVCALLLLCSCRHCCCCRLCILPLC